MERFIPLKINFILIVSLFFLSFNLESEEGKTWSSSRKAKIFVKKNIVIDFISSPYGIGWDDSDDLQSYFDRAIEMGITW